VTAAPPAASNGRTAAVALVTAASDAAAAGGEVGPGWRRILEVDSSSACSGRASLNDDRVAGERRPAHLWARREGQSRCRGTPGPLASTWVKRGAMSGTTTSENIATTARSALSRTKFAIGKDELGPLGSPYRADGIGCGDLYVTGFQARWSIAAVVDVVGAFVRCQREEAGRSPAGVRPWCALRTRERLEFGEQDLVARRHLLSRASPPNRLARHDGHAADEEGGGEQRHARERNG
jgi:hypothetical protein